MFTREEVIAEARGWLGTPWHHQASLKGVGCDCIGFIRGVAQPFVGEIAIPLDYPETWHLYRAEPRMYLGFKERCEEIEPADAFLVTSCCSAPARDRRITALTSRRAAA